MSASGWPRLRRRHAQLVGHDGISAERTVNESRRSLLRKLGGATLATLAARAGAQPVYPSRPVRFIVPFAAGGGPDLLARRTAPELARELDGNMVVENRGGAGGGVAAESVARAAPDGYTVMLGASSHIINKLLVPGSTYDPLADFAAVSQMWTSASMLVVPMQSSIGTIGQLIQQMRREPGRLNYASGGMGTVAHLSGGAFVRVFDLDAVHVPYRGSVDIVPALLSGQVHFAFPIASAALPAIRAGQVRPLAVTGPRRSPLLPEVPALCELSDNELLVQEAWGGLWFPAGTTQDIVDRMFRANSAALLVPELAAFHAEHATTVQTSSSPQAFQVFMHAEHVRWRKVLAAVGLLPGR